MLGLFLIAEGAAKEDILAGLHRTVAAKVQTMMERLGIQPDCALVGGGAKDIGLVKSIEERLACSLLVPEEPQIVAALDAAMIAGRKMPQLSLPTNLKVEGRFLQLYTISSAGTRSL